MTPIIPNLTQPVPAIDTLKPITAQQSALLSGGRAQMQAAKESAAVLEQELKNQELQRQAVAEKTNAAIAAQDTLDSEIEAKNNHIGKLQDEYGKLSIDNDRFWATRSTGQKVMAGIGILLGGLGGGENQALKIIDNAISRDIESQKANVGIKGQAISQEKGLLSELRLRLGDQRSAEDAARSIYANNVQLKLKAIAAKYQSPEIAAKVDMAVQQLEQVKVNATAEAVKNAQIETVRSKLNETSDKTDQIISMLPAEEQKTYRERRVTGPGFSGFAKTTERAKVLQDAASSAQNAMSTIDDILKIGQTSGRELMPTEASATANMLANMLKGQIKTEVVGPGAVSETEWAILNSIVANPTNIKQINAQALLMKLKAIVSRNIQNKARNEGMAVDKNVGTVVSARPIEGKI